MIQYFKDLFRSFLNTTPFKKFLTIFIIILYILIIVFVTVRVNVEVITPGSINHTVATKSDEKSYSVISIDTENKSGNIYTVGVYSHIQVSYFQYLLSQLSNDITIVDYDPSTDLSEKEEQARGVIHKDLSINNAIIVAYEKAKETNPLISLDYQFEGIIVSAISYYSKSYLEVGDLITEVEGTKVTSLANLSELISGYNQDQFFKLTVIREQKEVEINAIRVKSPSTDSYVLGIEAYESYKINHDTAFPKFEIANDITSIGPSGGAMMTLAIYNALTATDYVKDLKIAGTGTIDITGKVGDIGGVSQKIVTASLAQVDIFFVNPEDYDEALTKYNEIKPEFRLVKVESFNDILRELGGEVNE